MPEARPIGLPLTWSGSSPPLTVAAAHPGSERHIHRLQIDWPARDELDIAHKWSGTVPGQLELAPQPADNQHTLNPGALRKFLEIDWCRARPVFATTRT